MIKVVQIQYSPESGARSALRLQHAFINAGIESNILSLQSNPGNLNNVTGLGKMPKLISRIDQKIQQYLFRNNLKQYGLFSYPIFGTDISKLPEVKNADYIYVHWVWSGFLNFKGLERLARLKKPLIIVMHDMWNISGGCHYSFDCDKYITGCNNCPMLAGNKKNDFSAKGFQKKMQLYNRHKNLFFVSPSKWLYNCAKAAALTSNKPLFYIPNILDNTLFKPFDKNVAKGILNIDKTQTVLAFGAVTVNSPYKGWKYLEKALHLLQQSDNGSNILVLVFGSGYKKEVADAIPFKTKFMGFLNDEYSTMLVYNAADIFVVPSIADNQPTTVQESLSCGTPVVGFNVGGIPDMIRHKENGYLAKYKDAQDICDGIKYCLDNNLKGFMLPEFETKVTISSHLELFKFITESSS